MRGSPSSRPSVRPLVALALALPALACASVGRNEGSAAVLTPEAQAALTPDQVLQDLKAGNARFRNGRTRSRDLMAQARAAADGQSPMAAILGCIDSRVPAEYVFDAGIGDLFNARVAGNYENVDLLGSLEFATAAAGSKLVVVLGHSACGAVKGACDGVELGNLTEALTNIQPAIDAVPGHGGRRDSKNAEFVAAVVEENVRNTVRDLRERSPVLRDLEDAGAIRIVGAVYDLRTGRVDWL